MDDFKELIWFAVALMAAAFILFVVSVFGAHAGSMAATRNDEIRTAAKALNTMRYGALNEQHVDGADVIALLRENTLQRGALTIEIDKNIDNDIMTMNDTNYTLSTWSLSNLRNSISLTSEYLCGVDGKTVTLTRLHP